MKKIVLLYNFEGDRLTLVKHALLPLKTAVRLVAPEEYGRCLGSLVGIKGLPEGEESSDGVEGFDEEMLIMSGFSSGDIDSLIKALRKNGVGRIDLKAVITPTNILWNSVQLYKAVRADHEEMHSS